VTRTAVLICDQFIHHPPQEVWEALTDPVLLARWWAPGDIKPVLGHRFVLDMGEYGKQPCEVVDVDPGKLLAYTFSDGTLNTTITWRLAAEGDGTRLFLEQAGFDLESPVSHQAYTGMGSGWPHVLARIEGILDDMILARRNGSASA
jgi:uncharacterized protein YndB with AHSA1/START domain